MSFNKKMLSLLAVGALTAVTAVPAMALENEFHGMYKFMGYQSNVYTGAGAAILENDARSGFYAEQRARLMYIAKANDNLKLVTHFELDSRFGGVAGGYKGVAAGNDGGNLDADVLTLETKNVYLDFNEPFTKTNFKVGMQTWADSYNSLFLLADMTGVIASKKFDPAVVSLGWFRFDDNTTNATAAAGTAFERELTADLFIADAKFAINKDMKVGASYYGVLNDTVPAVPGFLNLHALGANADLKIGPATINPFAMYQIGEQTAANDINAYMFGAVAKVKAGPGTVSLSGFYLSGDDNGTGDVDSFTTIGAFQTYFNASNMWLLVRNGQGINTSHSVLNNDLTAGGRGTMGVFGGFAGTAGKAFYNANVGYMRTTEERGTEDNSIGTEINAQVGYKMFDNMTVSAAAAYAFLGDGLNAPTAAAGKIPGFGGVNAEDPYLINMQVAYTF